MKFLPFVGAAILAACAKNPPQHAETQPPSDLEARVSNTQSPSGQFGQSSQYGQGEARLDNRGEMGESSRSGIEGQSGANLGGGEMARGGEMHGKELSADKGLCPIDVPGARAQVRATGGNVVLLVTTTDTNQVDELRRRARDFSSRTARFSSAQGSSDLSQPGKMDNEDETGRRDTVTPNLLGQQPDQTDKTDQTDKSGQTGKSTDKSGQTGKSTDKSGQTSKQGQSGQQGQTGKSTDKSGQTGKSTDKTGQSDKSIDKTGQYGKQMGQAGQMGTMGEGVPVRITVQDVTDGVILVFAPTDSNRLNELQGLVQQDSQYLGQGRCPIGERRTSMAR